LSEASLRSLYILNPDGYCNIGRKGKRKRKEERRENRKVEYILGAPLLAAFPEEFYYQNFSSSREKRTKGERSGRNEKGEALASLSKRD